MDFTIITLMILLAVPCTIAMVISKRRFKIRTLYSWDKITNDDRVIQTVLYDDGSLRRIEVINIKEQDVTISVDIFKNIFWWLTSLAIALMLVYGYPNNPSEERYFILTYLLFGMGVVYYSSMLIKLIKFIFSKKDESHFGKNLSTLGVEVYDDYNHSKYIVINNLAYRIVKMWKRNSKFN